MYFIWGVGYEIILKEQKGQSMFVENKVFFMDELVVVKRLVLLYSGYNGQLLISVYQFIEMVLMYKVLFEGVYDIIFLWVIVNSQVMGSVNLILWVEDMYLVQSYQVVILLKDGKNFQVFRNFYVWDELVVVRRGGWIWGGF